MYTINASAIYVTEGARKIPEAETRLERMLPSIRGGTPLDVSYEELNEILNSDKIRKVSNDGRTGAILKGNPERILVFDTFRWNESDRKNLLKKYPNLSLLGLHPFTRRAQWNHEWCICQAAWEMHTLMGCLHSCAYCHINKTLTVMLNLEELVIELGKQMRTIPDQQLYKYDNYSDQITLEPEYGASELLVNYFATLDLKPKKYLLLYTKSNNVDHLLDLEHNGRTLINWTISPETQSRKIEVGTPSLEKRLESMKKCEGAGYTTRVRFSPMIPVKNWKEEYHTMIEQLFDHATPDVITMDMIGFMSPRGMQESLDMNLFDEEARTIIDSLTYVKRKWQKHVFPHDYRRKFYQFIYNEVRSRNSKVPVTICNETFEMWDDCQLKWSPRMGIEDYACCCGPTSVPGNKWLRRK
ncbi:MAG: spore photoproduct lyase family protein [Promethearchaeota archaeon]